MNGSMSWWPSALEVPEVESIRTMWIKTRRVSVS